MARSKQTSGSMFLNASDRPLEPTQAVDTRPVATDTVPAAAPSRSAAGSPVRMDTTHLKSSYANFATANASREEVVLMFGLNRGWDASPGDTGIRIDHRIVLNPYAAKRLVGLLQDLLREYQARHGELKLS